MSALLTDEGTQVTIERAASSGRGRLWAAWHRIRMTVHEMNYAAQRVVEVQAPWSVDGKWRAK